MNKVIFIGRVSSQPEVNQSGTDNVCVTFSIAVKRKFVKNGGPDTDFFDCVAFKNNAQFIEKYVDQGMRIFVAGNMQNNSYQNRDGDTVWTTELVVEEVEALESKAETELRRSQTANRQRNR